MENLTETNDKYLAVIENIKMVSNMSEVMFHDFKNTLATISGLSQLSMLMTESEQVKSNLSYITQATFDLRDSLNRFYNFTKGNSEELQKPYLLYNIIDGALDMIKFKFETLNSMDHKINLNLNINSNAKVWCNEYELKQSLLNILINAMDAMEDTGGTLNIEIYNNNDDIINIDIYDSGSGISKENLDRLFKTTFTTKEKGTGLGLKIAKNTIEKFKGSISLNSELGVGTKVHISLPMYYDEDKSLNC